MKNHLTLGVDSFLNSLGSRLRTSAVPSITFTSISTTIPSDFVKKVSYISSKSDFLSGNQRDPSFNIDG